MMAILATLVAAGGSEPSVAEEPPPAEVAVGDAAPRDPSVAVVSLRLPITGTRDTQVEGAILRTLDRLAARPGERGVLVLQFDGAEEPGSAASDFGRSLALARFLADPRLTGVKTVAEFVALAKKDPGKLNYGSPGNGTPHHLAMELFKQRAGIALTHIPYKGSDGMMTGILGGQISAVFMPIHQALTNVQAGRIVMLSASGTKRSSATPNVPSLGEAAGIRDIDVDIWFGVYLPAAAPKDIVTKLNTEINAIIKLPEVADTLAKQGLQPTGGTPAELADLTSSDLDRWARVIRDANIRAD